MSLSQYAQPTLGNIRRRILRVEDAALSGIELAKRWNPKGKHFYAQREIIKECHEIQKATCRMLRLIGRGAGFPKP